MKKERNVKVDMAKGWACFLVVFGHVIMGIRKAGIETTDFNYMLEQFIWTFHVALFIFLSGYVYHYLGDWTAKKNRLEFMKNKVINLAIPYFIFSIVYIVMNMILGGNSVNNEMGMNDLLFIWKTPVAQYWFLYALFFLFLWFVFWSQWLSTNIKITIATFAFAIVMRLLDINLIGPLEYIAVFGVVFGIGCCLERLYVDEWNKIFQIILICVHIVVTVICLYMGWDAYYFVDLGITFLGIFASIAFVSLIGKMHFAEQILLKICKYSFPIYLLHTIFTAGSRIVLIKVGVDLYFLHVIAGLIMGFAGPIIIAIICEKITILNIVFYPSRTLKILKNKSK